MLTSGNRGCSCAWIGYKVFRYNDARRIGRLPSPDFSTSGAIIGATVNIPAPTANLFAFLIWGTTPAFRKRYIEAFERVAGAFRIESANSSQRTQTPPLSIFEAPAIVQQQKKPAAKRGVSMITLDGRPFEEVIRFTRSSIVTIHAAPTTPGDRPRRRSSVLPGCNRSSQIS